MDARIIDVMADSIADELGIVPGECLVAINGHTLIDIIDYEYACQDEVLELEIRDLTGESYFCDVEKESDEELGLVFSSNLFDGMHACCNHCLFCFMEQLPPDARRSLMVKDDDYRMSFWNGNYITGTNLRPWEIERIERLKLSPLYFSVHSTDPDLRRRLLGNKRAPAIMPLLKRLTKAGIAIHAQIVLCPGLNDGDSLLQTLDDLESLGKGLCSVAIVPVGLTVYQKNSCMRNMTVEEARDLITVINKKQAQYQHKRGSSFVFLADEIYLLARKPLPDAAHYEGFPQLENGVGLCRQLLDEWQVVKKDLPAAVHNQQVIFITGVSGSRVLQPIIEDLKGIKGLVVEIKSIPNLYFGSSVTVTGLITGRCLVAALEKEKSRATLILPSVMLKYKEDIFLDDMTLTEVQKVLGMEIKVVEPTASGIFAAINLEQE